MNCFEAYLVGLLQGHITYNNQPVEVVRQFSNAPQLPVITLDLSPGLTLENYFRSIDDSHDKLYFKGKASININTWCNTEQERESVNNQVLDCYVKSLNHHYRYCTRYNNGHCSTLDTACPAVGDASARAMKNQCPSPTENGYQCLSDKHQIVFGTVNITSPFFMDEMGEHPPLLRSVFRAEAYYTQRVSSAGSATVGYDFVGDGVDVI